LKKLVIGWILMIETIYNLSAIEITLQFRPKLRFGAGK